MHSQQFEKDPAMLEEELKKSLSGHDGSEEINMKQLLDEEDQASKDVVQLIEELVLQKLVHNHSHQSFKDK